MCPRVIKRGKGNSYIDRWFSHYTPSFMGDVPLPSLITRGYPSFFMVLASSAFWGWFPPPVTSRSVVAFLSSKNTGSHLYPTILCIYQLMSVKTIIHHPQITSNHQITINRFYKSFPHGWFILVLPRCYPIKIARVPTALSAWVVTGRHAL